MNTSTLLREIARLRPQAGSLIQTILELGDAVGSLRLGTIDENGRPTLSLPIIVHAMEVLDDYSKTKDFTGIPGSKVLHAYGLVERAISGEHIARGQLSAIRSARSITIDGLAGYLGSGGDVHPSDPGSDSEV